MSNISVNHTLGQIVAERPALARAFERLGLDYCCGGQQTLGQACAEHGLGVEVVLGALDDAGRSADPAERNWPDASLAELCDHIVATHHAYLKTELPRLDGLFDKVVQVHGGRHAELPECRAIFGALRAELETHMQKEELILFPLIAQMDAAQAPVCAHCGSVRNPIRVMEMEHDSAGTALVRLRKLTGDYVRPADACNSYQALLTGLAGLEADLHTHIHKENNILFPRAIQLEEAGFADRQAGREL